MPSGTRDVPDGFLVDYVAGQLPGVHYQRLVRAVLGLARRLQAQQIWWHSSESRTSDRFWSMFSTMQWFADWNLRCACRCPLLRVLLAAAGGGNQNEKDVTYTVIGLKKWCFSVSARCPASRKLKLLGRTQSGACRRRSRSRSRSRSMHPRTWVQYHTCSM